PGAVAGPELRRGRHECPRYGYWDMPLVLLKILFGAAFTIAASYSLGHLCLRRIPAPRVCALPVGAAILSTIILILLLAGAAGPASFAALGALSLAPMLWRNPKRVPQKHEP